MMWNGNIDWMKFMVPFAILDVVLKGFALWKSSQRKEKVWFIALLLVNSLGILPAIYLLLKPRR